MKRKYLATDESLVIEAQSIDKFRARAEREQRARREPAYWLFPRLVTKTLPVFTLLALWFSALPASAALLDQWVADDLNTLNDGDFVGNWVSASNRTAAASPPLQPVLKKNATPGGTSVVRFTQDLMTSVNTPVGGRTAFSVAVVFKADAPGANDSGNNWYGKTGLLDAEEGGVVNDWGTVLTEQGRVGIGSGNPDISTYNTSGASLVDSNYHIAVFTWGGGTQAVYVDGRAPTSQSGVAVAARNNARFSFGGIATGENGAVRRFIGDMAEVRFYGTALSSTEVSNVIAELTDKHLFGGRPNIRSFNASTNFVLLSNSVTLLWNVTNATYLSIDNGVGVVAGPTSNVTVFPSATTTYTLTATNALGSRTAQVTVVVDPGIPIAFSQSVTTLQNVARSLTLTGTDPNGGTLTYAIVSNPQHGALSGTPPNLTYTPTTGFSGDDSFMFKVNDGSYDSVPATIVMRVNAPPTPPTAVILSTTNISENASPSSFIAAIRSIDPNPEETHTYSLVAGFGDNAKFSISGNRLFAGATYAGGLGGTFTIRIRDTDSGGLSSEFNLTLQVVAAIQGVVINEIHFNPPHNTIREEFIELHNASGVDADLSFWKIRGGVDYVFAPGTTIPAGTFLVVAQNPATILSRYGMTALGPWAGAINNEGERITLRDQNDNIADEVEFDNGFPWPIAADGDGASMQLVNPSLDNDLGSSWRSALPTPGASNSVFAANAAPNIRQVDHAPNEPASTNSVTVTCKVTDPEGVASVVLAYQVVAPGSFIPAKFPLSTTQLNSLNTNPALTNALNPAFEAPTNWTSVMMHDDGLNGDAVAADNIYSVVLPPRANRTLVRYRITVADTLGESRRAPFEDDPSLNFAYFVYDGIPAYLTNSPAALKTLPIYTLITRDVDMTQCTAWSNGGDQLPQDIGGRNLGRLDFNWEGGMVYDGVVYDHVYYRLRGANGRYHPGKRSFRIRFNDGRFLAAKDQSGKRFPTKWRELTTGKGQSNRGGEQFALNEVVNFFLWNKVGVPAPATFHFHFRVVRGAEEIPTNQYAGDFWGLNWAQEKYDVNFLQTHGMPKGNLYKLVDNYVLGVDERRYQAAFAPTNAEDFFNIENNLTGFQSTDWLLAYANYTNWYRYFTVAEAIRHYDTWPSANKNGAWYFEPLYGASNNFLGRVMQLPYDSTDTWGPTWNNGEDVLFNGIFPSSATGGDSGQNPELQKEYRNVVRELRDLLFQPDQIIPLIDAFVAPLRDVAAADYARWLNAPSPASYASVLIPGTPGVTGGLPAYAQDMKNFMFVGGNYPWWIDRNSIGAGGWITRLDVVATDTNIPVRPTITYSGPPGFPIDALVFQSSAFADPQGAGTFGAMQWRVAEITPTNNPVSNPRLLKFELDPVWDSGELFAFNGQVSIPGVFIQPGHAYRARVRHKDNTGRWSRWSAPIEFIAAPGEVVGDLRNSLVISEIMYNPPAQGTVDGDEFEFLELKNIGTNTLNLTGLFFSSGINFVFTNGTMLAPGQTFLLGHNPGALQTRYPGLVVNGVYTGKLDNDGETLTIDHPQGFEVLSVTYSDSAPWPLAANGFGFSLVLADAASGLYRASANVGGSPGMDDPTPVIPGIIINEVLSSSTLPDLDTIELHNPTGISADLSGWYLTDDAKYPWKYRIPDGTHLSAGGYLVFDENQFNPTPYIGTSFALSSFGDDVYLFSANTNLQLTGYSHGFKFGGAATGITFGRYLNSVGEEQFPAQTARSFGGTNIGPRVGPVVINEIHYNPATDGDEFVELLNITGSPVPLFDSANPTNLWQVNGLGYTFPPGTSLGANQLLLLVSSDPAAFRAKYNVPASVQVLGPIPGQLQTSGERLELQAPDTPATNGVPYFDVEDIRYNDRLPWPTAADGAGASLQRLAPGAYGNDPVNWTAAVPTPGTLLPPGSRPIITAQPANTTVVAYQTAMFAVTATGATPLFYQWRFNGDRIAGATNRILILGNVQSTQPGDYSVDVYNQFGSTVSATARLTILIPAYITLQPQSQVTRPGSNITFRVEAISRTPVRFQWRFNGLDISGATNFTYTIAGVQPPDGGNYTVIVTDGVGPVVSQPAILTILVNPTIVQQPLSQSVASSGTAVFSVSITNTATLPIGYRWRRGGATLVSNNLYQLTDFLIVTNATNGAVYTVVVNSAALQTPGILSSNATLTILTDADGDGIPDTWETANGFNPTDKGDAALDTDLDGLTNYQEYIAGTDPRDPQSYLKVDRVSVTGLATLEFVAVSNKTYTVQYTDALQTGAWSKLANVAARATNHLETVIDSNPADNRFYRLATPALP